MTTETSWSPVDFEQVLDGSWSPPQASVGRRGDGVPLAYLGKVHTISSETEGGKTWAACLAAQQELDAGNAVLYLDFEDDVGTLVGRLLAMQTSRDLLRTKFTYIRPTEALGHGVYRDRLRAMVAQLAPTLVVIDGITEAMNLHGLDPLSNKDIASFSRTLPRWLADLGPAVVCLDHVVKASENRGRYALGGVHKLNGLDGAALILVNREPFGIGLTGISTVKIAKDRNGQLRRHGVPQRDGMFWFGDLRVTGHSEDFVEVEIVAPVEASGPFIPTVLMAKISAALEERGELSQRMILTAVGGKRQYAIDALNQLMLDGYVSDKTPHKLLKPFLPDDLAA